MLLYHIYVPEFITSEAYCTPHDSTRIGKCGADKIVSHFYTYRLTQNKKIIRNLPKTVHPYKAILFPCAIWPFSLPEKDCQQLTYIHPSPCWRFQLLTVIRPIIIPITFMPTSVYNCYPFLYHSINSNLTVTISSFITRHSLVRTKSEVFVLLYVCLFVCLFVNDFSTTRGPIHAKVRMQAYSGSGCVFSPFGGWRPPAGGKRGK